MTAGRRWALPALLALATTSALLLCMQALVWHEGPSTAPTRRRGVLDFVRIARPPTLETRTRRRPPRPVRAAPGALPRLGTLPSAPPQQGIAAVPVPAFEPSLSLAGPPATGPAAGAGDGPAVPLVRIPPQYPPRAQALGVEGWVRLRFTVTPEGGTEHVEVVDADPKGYFERAAIRAVESYRFEPRREGGVAVASPGEEIVISFELED